MPNPHYPAPDRALALDAWHELRESILYANRGYGDRPTERQEERPGLRERFWLFAGLVVLFVLSTTGLALQLAKLAATDQSMLPILGWLFGIAVAGAGLAFLAARKFRQQEGAAGSSEPPAADWREILSAAPVPLALFDAGRRLVTCNDPWRRLFPEPDAPAGALVGEHRLEDGTWVSFAKAPLAGGGTLVSATDITDERRRADEMGTERERMYLTLSAAGEWIWETDVLHRFCLVVPVRAGLEPEDLHWMTGRGLADLAARGAAGPGAALSSCVQDMEQHRRLVDVRLTLQDGVRVRPVRLNGVPRFGGDGAFLGYCGIGVFEAASPSVLAEPAPSVPAKPVVSRESAGRRILLVDDSATNRKLGISILRRMGYECDAAEDGRQAVEAVRGGDYDLVLMDIWMPSMGGIEATAEIRKLPEPIRSIPIVAMTAHAGSEDRQRCLESGMDGHIAKPVDRRALAAVLERLIGPANRGEAAAQSGPAALAEAVLVDRAVLEQLCSDAGPSLVSELIGAFMAETDERVLRMGPALQSGDFESVAAEAHAMKSSCGTFGALRLQTLVQRIESAAAQNDAVLASELFEQLPDLVAQSWSEFALAGYPQPSS